MVRGVVCGVYGVAGVGCGVGRGEGSVVVVVVGGVVVVVVVVGVVVGGGAVVVADDDVDDGESWLCW